MFLEKKYFFMRYQPKTMQTTLEVKVTLGRSNSLVYSGIRVYLHLNLIGFCQIFPIVHFFPALFSYV